MIGITFYNNTADTWIPHPSQKGYFDDVDVWEDGEWIEPLKGFWIPMEGEFSLTINISSNKDNYYPNNKSMSSEEKQGDSQPSGTESIIMDKVRTLNRQVLKSTVSGVYAANSVNGIAVTTEYAVVASVAGLSTEQVAHL